ncbi:putative T7SS-secreted protein [Rhodococcus marinonascens]|uniref:putative T7SS-secreted protein n=1 Tax=Rhodococcus marinonascens TaxID=38311 RepID=UPI000934BB2B|nr:hypothetical protein [Rhodococcus marinonascens]
MVTQPSAANPLSGLAKGPITSPAYPCLGFDPAPGNPGVVGRLSSELGELASKLEAAKDSLRGTGHSYGIWRGTAAEAFRNQVGELPGHLDTAGDALLKASRVLGDWSDDLSSFQRNGRGLEDLACAAKRNLESAQGDPGLLEANRTYRDPGQLAAAQSRLDSAMYRLQRAHRELDAIIERAESLARLHRELVELTARALDAASRDAPEEGMLDFLDNALNAVLDGIGDLAADIWKFIQDNADAINEISNALSTMSTVLGAAAFITAGIPFVSGPLATLSLGLGAAALAGHALAKAAGADVPWTTLALDTVGVAPGGASKLLDAGAAGAEAAAKAARSTGDWADTSTFAAQADKLGKVGVNLSGASQVPILGGSAVVQRLGIEDGVTNIFEDVDEYLLFDVPPPEEAVETVTRLMVESMIYVVGDKL